MNLTIKQIFIIWIVLMLIPMAFGTAIFSQKIGEVNKQGHIYTEKDIVHLYSFYGIGFIAVGFMFYISMKEENNQNAKEIKKNKKTS